MGARKTNRSTSSLVRNLGLTGADGFSEIAEGPVTPVIQIGDLGKFATEQFPVRGVFSTIVANLDASFGVPGVEITSLGESGLVIEDLRLEVTDFGIPGPGGFLNIPKGSWLIANMRDVDEGTRPRFPFNHLPVSVQIASMGSVSARTRVTSGVQTLPEEFGPFLPPAFQLQPGLEWFVPPGYDLVLSINAPSDLLNPTIGSVEVGFREVSGIGSGGFVRGQ